MNFFMKKNIKKQQNIIKVKKIFYAQILFQIKMLQLRYLIPCKYNIHRKLIKVINILFLALILQE